MPLPTFGASNVLPPFVGQWPAAPLGFSPYPATIGEVAAYFTGSAERRRILVGFLQLRTALRNLGFTISYQWLDGSFCENIEALEGRPPGDIDVMSFLDHPLQNDTAAFTPIVNANLDMFDHDRCKATYHCDHYMMSVASGMSIQEVCYWNAVFSHRRNGLWKGYVTVVDEGQAVDDALIASLIQAGIVP